MRMRLPRMKRQFCSACPDYKLDYRILEEPLLTVGLGVAFSKQDDRGLEQKLSETFEEMRADGTMEEIIGRYLEENDMGVIADVE